MNAFVAYPSAIIECNKTIGDGEFDYNENYPGATVKLEKQLSHLDLILIKDQQKLKKFIFGRLFRFNAYCHTMAVQVTLF